MRKYSLVTMMASMAVISIGGCASSAPISFMAATPDAGPSAYTCALRKLNEIGYTITNTNKEAGFITADKQTTGAFAEALLGKKYHDQLTVSSFDAGDGTGKLRVTAAQTEENAGFMFGKASSSGVAPSAKGKADANTILLSCAQGPITTASTVTLYSVEAEAEL